MRNDTQITSKWVNGPDGRGTADLVFSSVLTLLLCIYTAIHLNLSPEKMYIFGITRGTIYRLGWVLLALCIPEYVVYIAISQWRNAGALRENLMKEELGDRYHLPPQGWHGFFDWVNGRLKVWKKWLKEFIWPPRDAEEKDGECTAWSDASMMGMFFVGMGGYGYDISKFPTSRGDKFLGLSSRCFQLFAKKGIITSSVINENDLADKNKTDGLGKFLVCAQAGWWLVNIIARYILGLPTTLLELNVAVHVVTALVAYFFWWSKPSGITFPVCLEVPPDPTQNVKSAYTAQPTPDSEKLKGGELVAGEDPNSKSEVEHVEGNTVQISPDASNGITDNVESNIFDAQRVSNELIVDNIPTDTVTKKVNYDGSADDKALELEVIREIAVEAEQAPSFAMPSTERSLLLSALVCSLQGHHIYTDISQIRQAPLTKIDAVDNTVYWNKEYNNTTIGNPICVYEPAEDVPIEIWGKPLSSKKLRREYKRWAKKITGDKADPEQRRRTPGSTGVLVAIGQYLVRPDKGYALQIPSNSADFPMCLSNDMLRLWDFVAAEAYNKYPWLFQQMETPVAKSDISTDKTWGNSLFWRRRFIEGLASTDPWNLAVEGSVVSVFYSTSAIVLVFSCLYGMSHAIAWDSAFPSEVERLLWHISTITVTVCPVLLIFLWWIQRFSWTSLDVGYWFINGWRSFAKSLFALVWWSSLFVLALAYIPAKAFIMIETFISLRSLPVGVYQTVQWSEIIPHF